MNLFRRSLTIESKPRRYLTENFLGSLFTPDSILTSTFIAEPFGIGGNENDRNIYFIDHPNCVIRRAGVLGGNNMVGTIVGTNICGYNGDNLPGTETQLISPYRLWVDSESNIYFTDGKMIGNGPRFVRKYSATTHNVTIVVGSSNAAGCLSLEPATNCVVSPNRGIWCDPDGLLYFFDTVGKLFTVNQATGFAHLLLDTVDHTLINPQDIKGDHTNENIYILDVNFDGDWNVLKFPLEALASFSPVNLNPFSQECDSLWILADDHIFLSCSKWNIIADLNPTDDFNFRLLAGTEIAGFGGDSDPLSDILFNSPNSIYVDTIGLIWISDGNNGRIRMIT
eukprot:gene8594-9300_t